MKKIIFCLTAALLLVACNNKTENTSDGEATGNNTEKTEKMSVAGPDDNGQTEWIKQTTIMTSKPMVIDFFATWCAPCKELAPVVDEVEKNHKGEVVFMRIDVDIEKNLVNEFGVDAVPMLMFITPKGEYQTIVGKQPAEVIEAKIDELLKRSAQ